MSCNSKFVGEIENFDNQKFNIPQNYKFNEVSKNGIKTINENLNTKGSGLDRLMNRALKSSLKKHKINTSETEF